MNGVFRVFWEEPTNTGFAKHGIEIHKEMPRALNDFYQRVEDFEKDVYLRDEEEKIVLENLTEDWIVKKAVIAKRKVEIK